MSRARRILAAAGLVVGEHHVTYEYPGEAAAGKAYRRVRRRGGESISCWRYTTSSRERWYVTAIGEREPSIRKAERLMRLRGARRLEIPDGGEAQLDAMRERRFQTVLAPALAAGHGIRQEAHYGTGAVLDRRGRMSPYKRPQG